MTDRMDCRTACGACCIAPSISSPIPGMPFGKPAGVRCVQLQDDFSCGIFEDPARPSVCGSLKARVDMCGTSREQALSYLFNLEELTRSP